MQSTKGTGEYKHQHLKPQQFCPDFDLIMLITPKKNTGIVCGMWKPFVTPWLAVSMYIWPNHIHIYLKFHLCPQDGYQIYTYGF